jgi:hypothetical protein
LFLNHCETSFEYSVYVHWYYWNALNLSNYTNIYPDIPDNWCGAGAPSPLGYDYGQYPIISFPIGFSYNNGYYYDPDTNYLYQTCVSQ